MVANGTRIRRQRICELLGESGYLNVAGLATQLGTSIATIRRDLARLEADGAVRRVRGGVYGETNGVSVDFNYGHTDCCTDAKRDVARRAAQQLENGDAVYLDSGTIATMVAEELKDRHFLTVVTNSLAALDILRSSAGLNLFLVGGAYDSRTRSLIGPLAEQAIKFYRFRKMILTAAGIDTKRRELTLSEPDELAIKRAAVSQSEKVILVTDGSNFEQPSLIGMIPLDDVHTVVTDRRPSPEAVEALAVLGIQLICVT